MKKVWCVLICFLFLWGCSGKAVPDWTKVSYNQLESYKKNYLQNKLYLAEINFKKAVEEIKSSGDFDLLEKAYLTKYALHTAVLDEFDDHDYRNLEAIEPHLQNIHFHAFLKGDFNQVDEKHLPNQYQPFLGACKRGNPAEIDSAIAAISSPMSKLIASGIAVRAQLYQEATLNAAVRTAAEQGWKKALLVYLDKLKHYYESVSERDKADLIRRRIDLIR